MRLKLLIFLLIASMAGSPVLAADKTSQEKLEEQRKLINEKRSEINGSKWEVLLGSLDPKFKEKKDTFVFQDDQVSSAGMSKRGFGPTNYTITVPEDADSDVSVWETMKTGKDGIIFIRGEWTKDRMRGDVTEQLDGGKEVREYIFTASSRETVSPTSSSEGSLQTALQSNTTDQDPAVVDSSGARALVSKESTKKSVTSFTPGTTDEISKTSKKRGY